MASLFLPLPGPCSCCSAGDRRPQSARHKRVRILGQSLASQPLGLLPGFPVFPGQPFHGGLHQRSRGRVLVSTQAVGCGDRRLAHARSGQRPALRLHQMHQVH